MYGKPGRKNSRFPLHFLIRQHQLSKAVLHDFLSADKEVMTYCYPKISDMKCLTVTAKAVDVVLSPTVLVASRS